MFSLQSVAKLLATGDWKKAERQLKVLRRRYPERADVAYNYALVVRERGRFDEALEMLAETARRFPDYPRASFEHANTLVALGCETEAVERLERYLGRWPEDADAHLLLGRIRVREGNTDRARQHLAAVERQVADNDPDATLLAAQIHLRDGDLGRAQAQFRQLSRADPALRPSLVKELTQAPRGRIPLDSRRLGWN